MKKLWYLFAVVLLYAACNQKGTNDNSQSTQAEVKTDTVVVKEYPSAKNVVLKSENDIIGLWTGTFLQTDFEKEMEKAVAKAANWDSSSDMEVEYTLKDIKKLPEKGQKLFFKDLLYGTYDMKAPNKLSIKIESISDGKITGKSICAGNERPITGTYTRNGNAFKFKASEPGDDKYDGAFEFMVDLDSNTTVGNWTPTDTGQEARKFELSRKEFIYAPLADEWDWDKDYVNKNVSTQVLKSKDVENQSQQHLRVLRNLIYARHGYSFKQHDIRQQFEVYDWYLPVSTDVRDQLTDTEKQNEALLKRYEEYAKSYYDDYGR